MARLAEQVQRLRRDYELWAEKLYRIRNKDNELIPLRPNLVQRRVGRAERGALSHSNKCRLYVLKGRQGGVTTDQQARALHGAWGTPGFTALTLAHARDDTDKIFHITRRAIREFPKPLLPTLGKSEATQITFPELDSFFWTGTAGAKRIGRGITLNRFHGSEFAFWEDPKRVLSGITPALVPRGSIVVLETTADEFESDAHKFWRAAVAGENAYTPIFVPWWECDVENYQLPLMDPDELGGLSEEEFGLVQRQGLSLEQIKWRRSMILEMDEAEFIREYPEDPETCWITGGQKFYSAELIRRLLRETPKPIKIEMGGRLKIYGYPWRDTPDGRVTERVIIGSDVAEGVGGEGDRSTWSARSWPTGRKLATFADNGITPEGLATMLNKWGRHWPEHGLETDDDFSMIQEALLVVEKNHHGITTLRKLRDEHRYPMRSIYHRTPLGKTYDAQTDYIGWVTTGESKPLLLDAGRSILKSAGEGHYGLPCADTLRDAYAVTEGELTGRDVLVADMLAFIGREYAARSTVEVLKPLHW